MEDLQEIIHVAYLMAPILVTLSEVTFAVWNFSNSHTLESVHELVMICLRTNQKCIVSCNMKDFWRSQAVACTLKGVIISETVQDENFVITGAFCDGTLWYGIPAPLSHCTQILRKPVQGMWPHR